MGPQFHELAAQSRDFHLQRRQSFIFGEHPGANRFQGWGSFFTQFRGPCEKVGITLLLASRLTGEQHDQGRFPLGQIGENGFGCGKIGDGRHALGAAAQLANRLRAAQQQFGEDRQFLRFEAQQPVEIVTVLGGAHPFGRMVGKALEAEVAALRSELDELRDELKTFRAQFE